MTPSISSPNFSSPGKFTLTTLQPYGVLAAAGRDLYEYICSDDIVRLQLDRLQLDVRKELQRKKNELSMSATQREEYQRALDDERDERRLLALENTAKHVRSVSSHLSHIESGLDRIIVAHTFANGHLANLAANLERSADNQLALTQVLESLKVIVQASVRYISFYLPVYLQLTSIS
ncbi:hypothetical protein F4781DRAFT_410691 [Annulohypoxylon bovei var. microspora]|nr:hypothetical protein F4781DRAFT_410691 [Annulohypoxylon bovei var. microspora]